jgi:hypothetical protein
MLSASGEVSGRLRDAALRDAVHPLRTVAGDDSRTRGLDSDASPPLRGRSMSMPSFFFRT